MRINTPRAARPARSLLSLILASSLAVAGMVVGVPTAQASDIADLDGVGIEADPLIIKSAADLDLAADAVNGDYAAYGSLHYRLGADIDYANGAFETFAKFSGVFDGGGHTIKNIAYDSRVIGKQQSVAFFTELNGATVSGLTLDTVTSVITSAAAGVTELVEASGLARTAIDSTIDGNVVRNATVSGPDVGNGYNSGFVSKATNTVISNNMIAGDMKTTGDKYASAFLGYQGAGTAVEKNLVAADATSVYTVRNTAGGDNNSSGVLVDYIGADMAGQEIRGNVVFSGSVYAHATGAFSNLGWIAAVNADQVEEYGTNLVNASNNRVGFPTVAETGITNEPLRWTRRTGTAYAHNAQAGTGALWRPGNEGTLSSDLHLQATYENLGWDFTNGWRWDTTLGHPVPQSAPSLTTRVTSLTVGAGAAKTVVEILAALGAEANRGTPTIDLSGVDFGVEDVYPAVVTVSEGRFTASIPVEITITGRPFITLTVSQLSYQVGSTPPAADVLIAAGASADRGVLAIDLSAVNFNALGSYSATVTATDNGDTALPVVIQINVVPLAGAGTAASPFLISTVADLDAAVVSINADTAGIGAAKAHYRLADDVDYQGAAFTQFSKFSGSFDGAGHSVSNLAITAVGNPGAAFFGELVGATVKGLTFANIAATNSLGTSRAAVIAGTAASSQIIGNSVLGSSVTLDFITGSNNGQAAGLVASTSNGTMISDNTIMNTTVIGAKYAAGVSAYPLNNQGNSVKNNLLVDVSVSARATGGGSTVGLINAQGGTGVNVSGNVVIRGGIGAESAAGLENIFAVSTESTVTSLNYVSAATTIVPKGARVPTQAQATELPTPTLEATYSALGWNFSAASGEWEWDDQRGYPVLLTADFPTVPVMVDLAGGTDGGVNKSDHVYGASTKLVNPTRANYVFAGWTGTGIAGTSNDVTLPRYGSADLAYTATWVPAEFSIRYDLGGGVAAEGAPLVYTVETGLFSLTNPTRDGYTFAGWTGTGLTEATTSVTIAAGASGNRAYVATWTPLAYEVTYDLTGGTSSDTNKTSFTVESESFSINNPTRVGYVFAGWTGTGLAAPSKSVTVALGTMGALNFMATWTPISYHVIYDVTDEVEFLNDPAGVYTVESKAFTLPVPIRHGYTFAGWTGTDLTKPTLTVTVPTGSFGERTYAPTWMVTKFSIRYNLSGGKASKANPVNYTVTSAAFAVSNPTRVNYTFAGWTGLGVKRTKLTVPRGTVGHLNLTATWTKKAQKKAKVSAKLVKKTKKQKNHAKVTVVISQASGYSAPSGKISMKVTGKVKKKVRGKTRTVSVTKTVKAKLKAGKVTVSIPKSLTRGNYKIKVTYNGDSMYKKNTSSSVSLKRK